MIKNKYCEVKTDKGRCDRKAVIYMEQDLALMPQLYICGQHFEDNTLRWFAHDYVIIKKGILKRFKLLGHFAINLSWH